MKETIEEIYKGEKKGGFSFHIPYVISNILDPKPTNLVGPVNIPIPEEGKEEQYLGIGA